jgi:hypothetical protein
VVWEEGDYDEHKKGLWIIPLGYLKDYDSRLDVVRKLLLGNKCVRDIEERGGKYGSKLCFHYCNGKRLMDSHGFLFYLKYAKRGESSSH